MKMFILSIFFVSFGAQFAQAESVSQCHQGKAVSHVQVIRELR